jgi:hypothetical protein
VTRSQVWLCILSGIGLGILAFVVTHPAKGQDIREHHEHQSIAGQFYATWLRPNGGHPRTWSCCSSKDCYQTVIKRQGGHWYAQRREDGQWIPIPDEKLEHLQIDPRESPDGQSHVCAPPPWDGNGVYCAVIGSQG